ncbi:phosphoprotein [Parry Creek virus]|uniref:Phosphoprotein n=1 Tax=Parry Creek virus TaxID=318845 RepID=A0A0D3R1I7_9RHAB|nr:phosphoprotein [Parry Creek virus]AJR28320.1 phosphoprotein [Parry Creek virus]
MDNYKQPSDLKTGLNWEKVSSSMENQVDDTESAAPDLSAFIHESADDLKAWATSLEDWASKLPDPPEELPEASNQEPAPKAEEKQPDVKEEPHEPLFSSFNMGPVRFNPGLFLGLIDDLCRASRFGDLVTIDYKEVGSNFIFLYHIESGLSRRHNLHPIDQEEDEREVQKEEPTQCCPYYKEVLEDLSKGIVLKKRFGDGSSKLTMRSLGDIEDIETKWITTLHKSKRECLDNLLSLKGKKKMLLRTYNIDY